MPDQAWSGRPGIVAITIEPDSGDCVRSVRDSITKTITYGFEPGDCRERSCSPRLDVVVQTTAILHGHEHSQRAVVPLNDESLAGRRRIQDATQRLPQIEGGDDSHGSSS